MNHFLLPECPPNPDKDKGHYGDSSTELLIAMMKKLAPNFNRVVAQVYGGGAVVGHLNAAMGIGDRNAMAALQVLKKHGIRVVKKDIGGTNGRRIYFDTQTNKVRVKVVQKSEEGQRLAAKRADIASRNTKILVVDDSSLVRKILCTAINETPGLEVCGEAADAFEARDHILALDPDVISLDIIMPKLDGLKFLKKLSQHFPKPVVICSTIAKDGSNISQRAIQYGAVGVIDKDSLKLYEGMDTVKANLIPILRQAAGKVVRKRVFN
jgi:two-component system chemotaxis response regulator CheB